MMGISDDLEAIENSELILFHAKDCYVYLIPPRKSTASYRADEWNINKWDWEGVLKVISKGEECTIRLEDSKTGELYAQAPVRAAEPLPVEAVIDSSRFFVLRIEDNSGPQARHAFIGIGFRDRVPAYDFQAAVYDHIKLLLEPDQIPLVVDLMSNPEVQAYHACVNCILKLGGMYLNRKKQAEELVQEYVSKPTVDYSLKDGETLRLNLKSSTTNRSRSRFFDQNMDSLQHNQSSRSSHVPFLAPPPNPAVPITLLRAVSHASNDKSSAHPTTELDDDFGDFQMAG